VHHAFHTIDKSIPHCFLWYAATQTNARVLAEAVITWATRDKATVPDGEVRWAEMKETVLAPASMPGQDDRTERTHLTGPATG
jgi:hypothetical protein